MELKELKEDVRKTIVKNNLQVLDVLATGHNLIMCIENKQWERLPKLTSDFIRSYNNLIDVLNIHDFELKVNNIKYEDAEKWVMNKHRTCGFDKAKTINSKKCFDMMYHFAVDMLNLNAT